MVTSTNILGMTTTIPGLFLHNKTKKPSSMQTEGRKYLLPIMTKVLSNKKYCENTLEKRHTIPHPRDGQYGHSNIWTSPFQYIQQSYSNLYSAKPHDV